MNITATPGSANAEVLALVQVSGLTMPPATATAGPDPEAQIATVTIGQATGIRIAVDSTTNDEYPTWTRIG